ncbi:hypothetical protein T439DRAFT_333727 [Meredithblackwellia eburnea MCA 4105]
MVVLVVPSQTRIQLRVVFGDGDRLTPSNCHLYLAIQERRIRVEVEVEVEIILDSTWTKPQESGKDWHASPISEYFLADNITRPIPRQQLNNPSPPSVCQGKGSDPSIPRNPDFRATTSNSLFLSQHSDIELLLLLRQGETLSLLSCIQDMVGAAALESKEGRKRVPSPGASWMTSQSVSTGEETPSALVDKEVDYNTIMPWTGIPSHPIPSHHHTNETLHCAAFDRRALASGQLR